MRRVRWTRPAMEDLAAIDAYWQENASDRADAVLGRIEAAAMFLAEIPEAGPEFEEIGARKWSIARTRYQLFYRVRDSEIQILRARHASENRRDPS
ncbi:type II toxin-antitoxin system RelE/ParE family toxin [Flavisphingomonas formosensis]|uniref:type II toxin-antitoxin system RelE/ParE family toxin n=1 Tax=Flavisphingomonas formosensis TaxID=861534 RepID=UPI0022B761ED|nr:type II toxin-antitoxin system RelE/ParE family toxin [Sphingomonas formosensis]